MTREEAIAFAESELKAAYERAEKIGYKRKTRYIEVLEMAIKALEQEPQTGHWIDIMVGDMPAQACDRCNTFYPLAYTGGGHKYCPNCGTKMEV